MSCSSSSTDQRTWGTCRRGPDRRIDFSTGGKPDQPTLGQTLAQVPMLRFHHQPKKKGWKKKGEDTNLFARTARFHFLLLFLSFLCFVFFFQKRLLLLLLPLSKFFPSSLLAFLLTCFLLFLLFVCLFLFFLGGEGGGKGGPARDIHCDDDRGLARGGDGLSFRVDLWGRGG